MMIQECHRDLSLHMFYRLLITSSLKLCSSSFFSLIAVFALFSCSFAFCCVLDMCLCLLYMGMFFHSMPSGWVHVPRWPVRWHAVQMQRSSRVWRWQWRRWLQYVDWCCEMFVWYTSSRADFFFFNSRTVQMQWLNRVWRWHCQGWLQYVDWCCKNVNMICFKLGWEETKLNVLA